MTIMKNSLILTLSILSLLGCNQPKTETINKTAIVEKVKEKDWKSELGDILKVYGHRNWVVVADAAYPRQSHPAIQTINIDASQLEAVEFVSELIDQSSHVDANIYVDKEMAFVDEKYARGIEAYRNSLAQKLKGKTLKRLPHVDIIRKLDESANLFNVLILKTDLTIPYTSVFFQLECGYWDSQSEEILRSAMEKDN